MRGSDRQSAKIWAMLSGYPSPARKARQMLMLQAFFDDSGRGQEPVFVLAGFMSSPDRWAEFSDKWADVLAETPKIDYFKMREANYFAKQFKDWSRDDRDRKISKLFALVEKYTTAQIRITIDLNDFRDFNNEYGIDNITSPYYLMVFKLIHSLVGSQERNGIKEKIDFIFDRQQGEEARIRDAWDDFRKYSPKKISDLLGSPPDFRSDLDTMPLQAADCHAWWVRRRRWEQRTGQPPLAIMWTPTVEQPTLIFDVNKEQLVQMILDIRTKLFTITAFFDGKEHIVRQPIRLLWEERSS